MRLSDEQLKRFDEDGFLILPGLFSAAEVERLRAQLPALFAEDCPENWREKGTQVVRTAFSLHRRNALFDRLARHPRLLAPASRFLRKPLYIQQCKVNVKEAFTGELWQWHYDFATHQARDGVLEPLALNLHVFLDDVTEFNGPLYFIRGSHRRGPVGASLDPETTSYPLWVVEKETVGRLVAEGGLVAATGAVGTALIFGDALVHGSPPNMSPWPRRIFSVIVNPISNALTRYDGADHQHERDLTAIVPLGDDCLLAAA